MNEGPEGEARGRRRRTRMPLRLTPSEGDEVATTYTSLLRRVPIRKQSQAKVDRILDAAEALLIERGYEEAVSSPTLLIERADIAGGSFYTYFASPENVMETLALRLMEDFKAVMAVMVEEVHPDWRAAADRYSGTVVTFYQHAAARELWLEGHLSRAALRADANANAWSARRLEHMLHIAEVPGPKLDAVCYRVAVEILDYVMRLAYRSEGAARKRLLHEARSAFLVYLSSAGSSAAASSS